MHKSKRGDPTGSGIARQTMAYGVGVLISRAVSFFMTPVYTRFLTPGDYGVIQLVEMTLDVISVFAGIRLSNAVFRYYPLATNEEQRKAVVSTALWLVSSLLALAGLSVYLASPEVSELVLGRPAYAPLVRLAAASMALQGPILVGTAYLRSLGEAQLVTRLTVAKTLGQATLNALFLAVYDMGAASIFLSTFFANFAMAILIGSRAVRECGWTFDGVLARRFARYALPLAATQVATFTSTYGDRYFLQGVGGSSSVGLYALAYQFGFLIHSVGYLPFSMAWEAMRFRLAVRADRDLVIGKVFLAMNFLLLSAAVCVSIYSNEALRLMTTPAFYPAARLIPVIVLAYVVEAWADFQETGALLKERTEFVAMANWISAIVALVGYATMIPRWGGQGAAWATVLAFVARLGATHVFSERLHPVKLPVGRSLVAAALSALTVVAAMAISGYGILTAALIKLALFAAFIGMLLRLQMVPIELLDHVRPWLPVPWWKRGPTARSGATG